MAARKKSSKKSAAKKTAAKKKVSKKKVAKKVTKKAASKKKAAKKSSSKKPAKKKAVKKKPASKKAAKKKVSKKKASKKKVAKKTPAKKKAAKKKVSKKKASKKKVTKKKVTKKAAKKKASKKNVAKKAPAKKAAAKTPSKKKAAPKKAVKKKVVPKTKARVEPPKPAKPKRVRDTERKKKVILSDAEDAIHGIAPYVIKGNEEYMNDDQLDHFEAILLAWKAELMQEVDRTVHHMQDEASNFPDPNDRATQESEFGLELRTRDRERKLLKKIEQALIRIEEGEYGYCEETGEEIGLKRLEARPVATLCVEAQERRELAERQFRDSDDRYR